MGKKLISAAVVAVLMLSMTTTAFAAPRGGYSSGGYGACGGSGYSLMRDSGGNLLSQKAFEANLDKAIADGYILKANRQYYVDMYNYCAANGGFGGCGGSCY